MTNAVFCEISRWKLYFFLGGEQVCGLLHIKGGWLIGQNQPQVRWQTAAEGPLVVVLFNMCDNTNAVHMYMYSIWMYLKETKMSWKGDAFLKF